MRAGEGKEREGNFGGGSPYVKREGRSFKALCQKAHGTDKNCLPSCNEKRTQRTKGCVTEEGLLISGGERAKKKEKPRVSRNGLKWSSASND